MLPNLTSFLNFNMTHYIILSNVIVMNKYIWMCRQLRNFNDAISIVNWANATMHVKALLLDDEHGSLARLHSSTTINQQSYDPDCSITSPTTICIQPTPNQRPSATTTNKVTTLIAHSLPQRLVFNQPRKSLLPSPRQSVPITYQADQRLWQSIPTANPPFLLLIHYPHAQRGER